MFVGVANIAETTGDDELLRLAEAGVRGVRFNLYRGGSAEMESVSALGRRAWDVAGMHVEFYLDANDLAELETVITALPKVSIDHLGMTSVHRDVLLRLVSGGVRVKATGFGRGPARRRFHDPGDPPREPGGSNVWYRSSQH